MANSDLQLLIPLLIELFSAEELRQFLALGPEGAQIVAALPGASVPLAELVFAAASLLQRHGLADLDFFTRLLVKFPRRAPDIEQVMLARGLQRRDLPAEAAPPSPTVVLDGPTFAVITALQLETTAMLAQLADIREQTLPSGTIVLVGDLRDGDHVVAVAVAQAGAGNLRAAALTVDVGQALHPAALLFVGVAGAIKDVQLGDVVVANKIYGYASGKEAASGKGSAFLPRPDVGRTTHRMEQRASADALVGRWLTRRRQAAAGAPRAVVGPIAAGEAVVASTRSATYKFLRAQYSDALAIEMEGRGFLEAAHLQHAEALVIRGISDRIDRKAGADADGWQPRAADNAAAFAAEVMLNLRPARRPHA